MYTGYLPMVAVPSLQLSPEDWCQQCWSCTPLQRSDCTQEVTPFWWPMWYLSGNVMVIEGKISGQGGSVLCCTLQTLSSLHAFASFILLFDDFQHWLLYILSYRHLSILSMIWYGGVFNLSHVDNLCYNTVMMIIFTMYKVHACSKFSWDQRFDFFCDNWFTLCT